MKYECFLRGVFFLLSPFRGLHSCYQRCFRISAQLRLAKYILSVFQNWFYYFSFYLVCEGGIIARVPPIANSLFAT